MKYNIIYAIRITDVSEFHHNLFKINQIFVKLVYNKKIDKSSSISASI